MNMSSTYGNFLLVERTLKAPTRMRLGARKKLDEFCGAHSDARSWISNWAADTKGGALWKSRWI
jgi:hypothetical protein